MSTVKSIEFKAREVYTIYMQESYLEKKIYYHDTDCGGVVYYANYLKYLEEGRTDHCLKRGIDLKDLAEEGIYLVVARVEIDYKSPAKYQDLIRVVTRIEEVRRSLILFHQEIFKDSSITLVQSRIVLVCVGKDFKPISIPQRVRSLLTIEA